MNTALLERAAPLRPAKEEKTEGPLTVLGLLDELGLSPFKPKSVQRYKADIAGHYLLKSIPGYLTPAAAAVVVTGGLVLVMLFLTATIAAFRSEALSPAEGWAMVGTAAMFVAALAFSLKFGDRSPIYRPRWDRDRYRPGDRVPDFVRHTADTFRNRLPEATVYVESLHVQERVVDPFLVVVEPETGREYYVEVWNEPKFDAEREV